MACVDVREGAKRVLTMLSPLISCMMGYLIAFLYTLRSTVSYGTSLCVSIFGLHPPCFHPVVCRLHSANKVLHCKSRTRSTRQKLFKQRRPRTQSKEWFTDFTQDLDMATSNGPLQDASSSLAERQNSLRVFPETKIGDADHLHAPVSKIRLEHDMILFSDDEEDTMTARQFDAIEGIETDGQIALEHVSDGLSELVVFKPFEDLLEINARPTDDDSHVCEAELDCGKQVFLNNSGMLALTPPHSHQDMQDEGLKPELSAQKSENMAEELYAQKMQKGRELTAVSLNLKQKLSAQRQGLHVVHALLEKQRMASSVAAQESMALISILQKEKAALMLEAMQCQRVAEEKELFDENALVDLRDCLIKQEAELLALEKEKELYRRKISLRDRAGTIEERKMKCWSLNGEATVQQHLMSPLHPSPSTIFGASASNPCEDVSGAFDNGNEHLAFSAWLSRGMVLRDTSRVFLKKEALELLSRLQGIEADRELMRHALGLRRKEGWEMRLLQEVAEALKCFQFSDGSRIMSDLHRACSVSAVEAAETFGSKRRWSMEC